MWRGRERPAPRPTPLGLCSWPSEFTSFYNSIACHSDWVRCCVASCCSRKPQAFCDPELTNPNRPAFPGRKSLKLYTVGFCGLVPAMLNGSRQSTVDRSWVPGLLQTGDSTLLWIHICQNSLEAVLRPPGPQRMRAMTAGPPVGTGAPERLTGVAHGYCTLKSLQATAPLTWDACWSCTWGRPTAGTGSPPGTALQRDTPEGRSLGVFLCRWPVGQD